MAIQLLIFRLLFMSFTVGVYFYICYQLTRFAGLSPYTNVSVLIFIAIVFAAVLSMPLYFWTKRVHLHLIMDKKRKLILHFAHYSLAYLNFLLPIVLFRDLLAFLEFMFFAHNVNYLYGYEAFLVAFTLPLALTFIGFIPVHLGPFIYTQKVKDSRLPAAFNKLHIIHISDLHISMFLLPGFVDRLLKKLNKLKPDMIVMTGDIIDGPVEEHKEDIQKLAQLKAPLGVFFAPGNHEYYWGVHKSLDVLRSLGIQVLVNQAVRLRKDNSEILMSGIADPAAKYFAEEEIEFDKITSQFHDKSQYRILLAHQPEIADEAAKRHFHFQCSGHTHGGQFFPWNVLIYFFQKYNRGLYKVRWNPKIEVKADLKVDLNLKRTLLNEDEEKMNLYVNQGTGYWGPALRLGTTCELTEIVLTQN